MKQTILQLARQIVCVNWGITLRSAASAGPLNAPWVLQGGRWMSNGGGDLDVQQEMDRINEMFVEARDEIRYAQDDAGTTYFNESYDEAKVLVEKVLTEFDGLLARLVKEDSGKVQRSMGLKMEQLKAELKLLDSLHD